MDAMFCEFCERRLAVADDGFLVDADKGASGCSDSFDKGGDGEHAVDAEDARIRACEAADNEYVFGDAGG